MLAQSQNSEKVRVLADSLRLMRFLAPPSATILLIRFGAQHKSQTHRLASDSTAAPRKLDVAPERIAPPIF
jgi:hypothetical protein